MCGGCRHMYYCDNVCQKKDWKIHKLECKIYNEHYQTISSDLERMILRLHLTLEHYPNRRTKSVKIPGTDPAQFRSYDDLPTRKEKIEKDRERFPMFENLLACFRRAGLNYDREKLFEHFCKYMMNNFTIEDLEFKDICLAIFVLESGFEHSCVPNAFLIFNGINLEVRAMRKISPDDKITISLVDSIFSKEERQKELKEHYYFICSCRKCMDDDEESKFLIFNIINFFVIFFHFSYNFLQQDWIWTF